MRLSVVMSPILLVFGLVSILEGGEAKGKLVEKVISHEEKIKRARVALNISDKQYEEVLKKREEDQIKFSNLHPMSRQSFQTFMAKAQQLLSQREAVEALYFYREAERVFSHSPDLKSGLCAVYLEIRKFEDAKKLGEDLLVIDPLSGVYRYNLAEAFYASKEYKKSYEQFLLLEKLQKALGTQDVVFSQIVQFKLMLCLQGMNKSSKLTLIEREKALELYKKRYAKNSQRAVTKLYFYTKALEYFRLGDEKQSTKWIVNAHSVFPRSPEHKLWIDALVEFGHITSYYGGDEKK